MFNVRCWLLAIAFVFLGDAAQSQATAPVPRDLPQSSVPDNTSVKDFQLDAPSAGTVPPIEMAISTAVQLDTLKQVLRMIVAADQVKSSPIMRTRNLGPMTVTNLPIAWKR